MSDMGPRNEDERRIFIEEELRADLQYRVCEAMNQCKVTRDILAHRLQGMRDVDHILDEEWDPTITEFSYVLATILKGSPLP